MLAKSCFVVYLISDQSLVISCKKYLLKSFHKKYTLSRLIQRYYSNAYPSHYSNELTTMSRTKYSQFQNEWASCTKYITSVQPSKLIT